MSLRLRYAWMLSAVLLGSVLPAAELRAAETKASAALLEVDRVELLGVTALEGQDVESALEIIAGDSLERSKVVRSLENLQALYRARGFEQVRVKSELVRERDEDGRLENVVRIRVEEGQPTRIASIRIELPPQETGNSIGRFAGSGKIGRGSATRSGALGCRGIHWWTCGREDSDCGPRPCRAFSRVSGRSLGRSGSSG